MIVADSIIGNVNRDDSLADAFEAYEEEGKIETVTVDPADRKRSRVRTTTDGDTEIGIVVDEKSELESGDVLVLNDDCLIVVEFETREAMVIEYPEPESFDDVASVAKLGHVVGNHHWDLQIRDGAFYVPLSNARRIMESVVADVLPSDAVIRYELMDCTEFTDLSHQHHHHEGDENDR